MYSRNNTVEGLQEAYDRLLDNPAYRQFRESGVSIDGVDIHFCIYVYMYAFLLCLCVHIHKYIHTHGTVVNTCISRLYTSYICMNDPFGTML